MNNERRKQTKNQQWKFQIKRGLSLLITNLVVYRRRVPSSSTSYFSHSPTKLSDWFILEERTNKTTREPNENKKRRAKISLCTDTKAKIGRGRFGHAGANRLVESTVDGTEKMPHRTANWTEGRLLTECRPLSKLRRETHKAETLNTRKTSNTKKHTHTHTRERKRETERVRERE